MSVQVLQARHAGKSPSAVHVAYDRATGWWKVFTATCYYGGAPWKDEAIKDAQVIAALHKKDIKVHDMRRKR